MHVLISMDIEGCAGVVHTDQSRRGGHDYERARRWMTREANAAALGAFDAGAAEVTVNDSHADMRNLLFDELDPRVRVISGALKPLSMVQGVEQAGHGAVFFVGYHGGAGTAASVLDHTYYGGVVGEVRIRAGNVLDGEGDWMDEAGINALVAGEFNVPVALVTGDDTVTAQARARFPNVITVAVKRSITRFAAESIHPDEACARIRNGARIAMQNVGRVTPYVLERPYTLTLSMLTTAFADAAEIIPGVTRVDARRVRYVAPTAREMLRAVLAMTKLAGTVMT